MDEVQETARPVSPVRRIAGLVVLALGALIWLRMGWLVVFYGAWFRTEEWIRFWLWVWVGAELGLTGCWLRYRSRLAGWATIMAVPAFFGLVYLVGILTDGLATGLNRP